MYPLYLHLITIVIIGIVLAIIWGTQILFPRGISVEISLEEYFDLYGLPRECNDLLRSKYMEYKKNKLIPRLKSILVSEDLLNELSGINNRKVDFITAVDNYKKNNKLVLDNNIKNMFDYVSYLEKTNINIWEDIINDKLHLPGVH